MVLLTLISRVRDGLILATSIEGPDENPDMVKYTNQAKLLFRKLSAPNTPQQQTVESRPFVFHYVIKDQICCLCLCDMNFPRKSAFAYLEDIANEFNGQNGTRVATVTRPYHFLDFDSYIQQAKKRYTDRSRFAMAAVNNELTDVTRIMVSNIEDVIHRGEALNILESRASDLSDMSRKYRQDAAMLNRRSMMFKVFGALGFAGFIFLVLRFFVF
uniref:Vesicle-trafficking protein SEC22b n=1 Tax=Steinernema glaseri TaxID=37863 RepID=A0A1I7YZD2_9BILA